MRTVQTFEVTWQILAKTTTLHTYAHSVRVTCTARPTVRHRKQKLLIADKGTPGLLERRNNGNGEHELGGLDEYKIVAQVGRKGSATENLAIDCDNRQNTLMHAQPHTGSITTHQILGVILVTLAGHQDRKLTG